jgi:hypothetical protein
VGDDVRVPPLPPVSRAPQRTVPRQPDARELALGAAVTVAGNVAFPRLAHRLRWPARLGPRGLAAYVAWNTAVGFALRTWAGPAVRRAVEEHRRVERELRDELGREPTPDEVLARLVPDLAR